MKDFEVMKTALEAEGFHLVSSVDGPMDSGGAVFTNGVKQLDVRKERGLWELNEPPEKLKAACFWNCCHKTSEFKIALVNYVRQHL